LTKNLLPRRSEHNCENETLIKDSITWCHRCSLRRLWWRISRNSSTEKTSWLITKNILRTK